MIDLVPTVNAVDSNSYCDLDFYKSYLERRLPQVSFLSVALNGEMDEQLKVHLISGTRKIDTLFVWTGKIATETQALSWGREEMKDRNGRPITSNSIPVGLKQAACEMGLQMQLRDMISDNLADIFGVSGVKAGSIDVRFQSKEDSREAISTKVRLVSPEFSYRQAPNEVLQLLVPSWYVREDLETRISIDVY